MIILLDIVNFAGGTNKWHWKSDVNNGFSVKDLRLLIDRQGDGMVNSFNWIN